MFHAVLCQLSSLLKYGLKQGSTQRIYQEKIQQKLHIQSIRTPSMSKFFIVNKSFEIY